MPVILKDVRVLYNNRVASSVWWRWRHDERRHYAWQYRSAVNGNAVRRPSIDLLLRRGCDQRAGDTGVRWSYIEGQVVGINQRTRPMHDHATGRAVWEMGRWRLNGSIAGAVSDSATTMSTMVLLPYYRQIPKMASTAEFSGWQMIR